MIPKQDLKAIAYANLDASKLLFKSKKYDSSLYLVGYSIELALKYKICKILKLDSGFPETKVEFDTYINKMAKHNQHVVPLGNGWAVKREGSVKFTIITETKKEATFVARSIAKNNKSEIIIHGRDGKIQNRDSYGNDPVPPRDKVK